MTSQWIMALLVFTASLQLSIETEDEKPAAYESSYCYLNVRNRNTKEETTLCANYQQFMTDPLPATAEQAPALSLMWYNGVAKNYSICRATPGPTNLTSTISPVHYRQPCLCRHALDRKTCLISVLPSMVHSLEGEGADAALFVLQRGVPQPLNPEYRDFLYSGFKDPYGENVTLPVFYVYESTIDQALALSELRDATKGTDLDMRFYRAKASAFDLAMLLISALAVFCVTVGGWYSGRRRLILWRRRQELDEMERQRIASLDPAEVEAQPQGGSQELVSPPPGRHSERADEENQVKYNWLSMVIMIVMVVGILMLAYYFRSVMVWFFIVLYGVGSVFAAFRCLSALVGPIPCGHCRVCCSFNDLSLGVLKREVLRYEWCTAKPKWRSVLLFCGCVALSLTWFLTRDWPYNFILQDLLGVFFCIHIIQSIRFPNLKWISFLLVGLLVYDLFMVFISPIFTSDGCSIMVQVATGMPCKSGNGSYIPVAPVDAKNVPESLPILFRMPRLSSPMLPCYDLSVELQFRVMILGLGDVIIPGFLIGFAFAVDELFNVPCHMYGITTTVAYIVGLLCTFGALLLMNSAQPALIYLVPATLLTIIAVALLRREFMRLWNGEEPQDSKELHHINDENRHHAVENNAIVMAEDI